VDITADKYPLVTRRRKFRWTILDGPTHEADAFDNALLLVDESDIFEAIDWWRI
jgi:hypothetical protein